jgi:nucleoside phosphorylase
MAVDAQWMKRNLGITHTARDAAADVTRSTRVDLAREVIDFDSEGAAGTQFAAVAPNVAATLTHYTPPPWPPGLAPAASAEPVGESLPVADVLIVTWTLDEGHALSRVLTPGFDSQTDWKPYTKNYAAISADMRAGCPARELGRLGTYWTTRIGARSVTLFKSDSHMSQDGPKLANQTVWEQIIADTKPTWVITTGTGGGIGPSEQVGDVIVSNWVSFDCQRQFKRLNGQSYANPVDAPNSRFEEATSFFAANSQYLPADNTRAPQIDIATSAQTGILTTDFFGFDTSANTYGLQGHGALSEMGDAVLGMVCAALGSDAPNFSVVRNVSDPQIASTGLTLAQQETMAGDIYKAYGRWSSVCSAITCWAIVAAL